MQNPLVSVIIPNYNHSSYLKQRIDSILDQTFQDFEVIILDDCSTDDSVKVIESYLPNDKITHTVFNKNNSGSTFLQWQKGFSLARGKYIWIAESDDYSESTFLEKMVPLLENNENSNIAYCYSYLVDEESNILSRDWSRRCDSEEMVHVFNSRLFILSHMYFSNSIYNASMVLFRKSALEAIDDRYTHFRFCGDWYFWNQICIQGDVVRNREKLNYFRQHTHKVSTKADSEGIKFTEGKYVVEDVMRKLNLNKLQRIVVIGCYLREVYRFDEYKDETVRMNTIRDVETYFKAHKFYIQIFRLDRSLNFSGLDIVKNRHI